MKFQGPISYCPWQSSAVSERLRYGKTGQISMTLPHLKLGIKNKFNLNNNKAPLSLNTWDNVAVDFWCQSLWHQVWAFAVCKQSLNLRLSQKAKVKALIIFCRCEAVQSLQATPLPDKFPWFVVHKLQPTYTCRVS